MIGYVGSNFYNGRRFEACRSFCLCHCIKFIKDSLYLSVSLSVSFSLYLFRSVHEDIKKSKREDSRSRKSHGKT